MKEIDTISLIKNVTILPAFVALLTLFSEERILMNPLTGDEFIAIFLVTAAIGVLNALCNAIEDQNIFVQSIIAAIDGVFRGLLAGYTVLSLIVLYNWQVNSNIAHLEPLFITFGLAATGVEGARRITMSELRSKD
ncbi:hypothetical protein ACN930_004850 [Vibrio parahaemolyticus]|nr:hypothetical protein [Vibrio parahaemolyticus]HAS6903114.1 hypothetical protein [Vibrio parahaemolyticus]HCM0841057.1 hypothetical protein [Vibrio parahaemolyticus]